ncbi:MAG: hypothetical protein KC466_04420 [Myxococcales bacterium]|nr:hypothetical protein [Myxococcales bacterium]
MSGHPEKDVIRFQLDERDGYDVWSGRTPEMLIDLYVKNDQVVQIDINGYVVEFVPVCDDDGECTCYFETEEQRAQHGCPWGSLQELSTSHNRFHLSLDISREIPLEGVTRLIAKTHRPEFGAPASLLDALAFTWILMDGAEGARTVLRGGQVERPKLNGEEG